MEQNKILYVSPLSWNAELVNIAILKHSLLSDASHSVNRSRPSCCALEVAIVDLKSSMKGGSVYICNVNKLCIPAQRRHIRVHFFRSDKFFPCMSTLILVESSLQQRLEKPNQKTNIFCLNDKTEKQIKIFLLCGETKRYF